MIEKPTLSAYWPERIQRWEPLIVNNATRAGFEPDLIAAVIAVESDGRPEAVSHAGAIGLMQVMPFHFAPEEDGFNPELNIHRGVQILAEYTRQARGDVRLGLAMYHSGPRGALQFGRGRAYADLVLGYLRKAKSAAKPQA